MMTAEEAQRVIEKHGGIKKAAKALHVSDHTIRGALKRSPAPSGGPATKATGNKKIVGRTVGEFRETYDRDFIVPRRIREAIKALGASWLYEVEFAKLAEVSLSDLGTYRSMFEDKYVVTIRRDGKRAWAGTPKIAQELREMVK